MSNREIIDKVLRILGSSAPHDAAQHRKLERTISYGLVSVRRNSKEAIASGRYGVTTDKQKLKPIELPPRGRAPLRRRHARLSRGQVFWEGGAFLASAGTAQQKAPPGSRAA